MAYGNRTKNFQLPPVHLQKDYRELIHRYFGIKLPPIKVAVTGSGRVAHGILEIMNLLDIQEVEADEYLSKNFSYPVYVHLKGPDLYIHKDKKPTTAKTFISIRRSMNVFLNPSVFTPIFYSMVFIGIKIFRDYLKWKLCSIKILKY